MKSIKLLLGILMMLPLFILMNGCGGGGGGGTPVVPVLVAITVTPSNATMATGSVNNYTATGTYSNGQALNLTESAAWSSSATGVATVSDASGTKGTVTAVAAGVTTITATIGGVSGSTTATVTTGTGPVANVMSVTVNGSLCSSDTSGNYLNKPCVSVTICNPGTTTCQTVSDILLDTGSFGLRVFKQAIPGLTLPQAASGAGTLAGCVQFADGSSLWGPVATASVQLGTEPAVQIPIQVIDASFGVRPSQCSNADAGPVAAGFAGILGVGVFGEDCGPACASDPTIGMYFSCTGSGCTGATVPVTSQIQNPVFKLPQDNNGIQVQFPPVGLGGLPSVTGSILLGINTQTNNAPGSPTVFPTDSSGDFRTIFSGVNSVSFVDTGSNALFIPNVAPSVLPPCSAPNQAWYCPPVPRALFATAVGAFGSPSLNVPFAVGNFLTIVASPNNVFSELAGTSTFGFDWGMPFFYGKNVFFGFEGKTSPLGTGPYVAF